MCFNIVPVSPRAIGPVRHCGYADILNIIDCSPYQGQQCLNGLLTGNTEGLPEVGG